MTITFVTQAELAHQVKATIAGRLLAAEGVLILHDMVPNQIGVPTESDFGDLDLCRDLLDEYGHLLTEDDANILHDMLNVLWERCFHAQWVEGNMPTHRCTTICSTLI